MTPVTLSGLHWGELLLIGFVCGVGFTILFTIWLLELNDG
jgi:hypothetical protein